MRDEKKTKRQLVEELRAQRSKVAELSAREAEFRNAGSALRASEEKTRALFNGIPIPIYTWQRVDDDLVLRGYNDAAARITRGGVEQFVGIRATEMYADRPEIVGELRRCVTEQTCLQRLMHYTFLSTGEPKHLFVYYTFVPPDLAMVMTDDVSDRVRAADALRESEKKLRSIFASMNDLVFVLDREGVFVDYYPPSLANRLYVPPSEFLGRTVGDVMPPHVAGPAQEAIDAVIATGEPQEFDYELSVDGVETWSAAQVSARFDDGGELVGITVVSRDITQRKRVERELEATHTTLEQRVEERTRELVGLKEQAEQLAAMRERERLARDLHDAVVQTLFSISLIADALPQVWARSEAEGKERLQELRWMTRSALAESRGILLELRPAAIGATDLGDLVRQLADASRGRSGLSITLSVEGACAPPTDPKIALYRIAQEALNNAAKHAAPSRAHISLRMEEDRVELTVSDTGPGFDLEKVPPQRLGLENMRERAEGVGARLEIESRPGGGTTVRAIWEPGGERE
jgi:PAS domain S-box-containing protein